MPTTHNYRFIIQAFAQSPITHGMTTSGNEQVLRRSPVAIFPNGKLRMIQVPEVSGSAVRGVLRHHAVECDLARYGIEKTDMDTIRLIEKGGKLGGSESKAGVNLAKLNKLRRMFPSLDLFGCLDNIGQITGKFLASPLMLYCDEMVKAGLLPRAIKTMDGETFQVFPTIEQPPLLSMGSTSIQYYRHDLRVTSSHLLTGEATKQIEDQSTELLAKQADGKMVKTDERRVANESMPHSFEAIPAGMPLYGDWSLRNADAITFAAFLQTLNYWIGNGAHVGGGAAKGHGKLLIDVTGSHRWTLERGVHAAMGGELVTNNPAEGIMKAMNLHFQEMKEDALHFVDKGEIRL